MRFQFDSKDDDIEAKYQRHFSLTQQQTKKLALLFSLVILVAKGLRTGLLLAEIGDLENNYDFFYLYPICVISILLLFFVVFIIVERHKILQKNAEVVYLLALGTAFAIYTLLTRNFNFKEVSNYQYWVGIETESYFLIAVLIFKTLKSRIILLLSIVSIQMAENLRTKEDLICQITLWCMSISIVIIVVISEKLRRDAFKHFYVSRKNFMKILDVLPNSVIVLDSNKKTVFSNDYSQIMLSKEVQEPSPFRRGLVYQQMCSKFKKLTLRSGFGKSKVIYSRDQETRTPIINSLSCIDVRNVDQNCRAKLQQIEENIRNLSIDMVVDRLLENESFFREYNLHMDYNNFGHYFLTFEASSELRTFEINITFTNNTMAGSLLIIVHETTLINQINVYKLQEKTRSLALASISHELRNPLNGSLSLLECAVEDSSLPVYISQTFLNPAINTMKMMQSLVNDILDYSQIKENKFKLTFQEIDLRQVIYDTVSVVNMQAINKGLAIKVQISEEIPVSWNSDPKRLSQILLNLLSNALKFTKQGYISILAKIYDSNPNLIEISVEDTGIGMKKHDVNRLFKENYTKIDLGENAFMNAGGCGLGLNIANKLSIALARGPIDHMKVSSQEGKGSVFSFIIENKIINSSHALSPAVSTSRIHPYFPKMTIYKTSTHAPSMIDDEVITTDYVSHLDEQISREERQIFKMPTHSRFMKEKQLEIFRTSSNPQPSILIVDDDSFNVYSLQTVLKTFGLKASVAYNGAQAIEQIESEILNRKIADQEASLKEQSKLVFMDVNMPIMNGIEAAEYIKNNIINKNLMHIVIIGVTGESETHFHERMLNAGITEILIKPTNKKDIQGILEKYGSLFRQ